MEKRVAPDWRWVRLGSPWVRLGFRWVRPGFILGSSPGVKSLTLRDFLGFAPQFNCLRGGEASEGAPGHIGEAACAAPGILVVWMFSGHRPEAAEAPSGRADLLDSGVLDGAASAAASRFPAQNQRAGRATALATPPNAGAVRMAFPQRPASRASNCAMRCSCRIRCSVSSSILARSFACISPTLTPWAFTSASVGMPGRWRCARM